MMQLIWHLTERMKRASSEIFMAHSSVKMKLETEAETEIK